MCQWGWRLLKKKTATGDGGFLTFSIRLSYLCPILSHSDCSVIYLKQNVTPKYYIQNKSTFFCLQIQNMKHVTL